MSVEIRGLLTDDSVQVRGRHPAEKPRWVGLKGTVIGGFAADCSGERSSPGGRYGKHGDVSTAANAASRATVATGGFLHPVAGSSD